MYLFFDTETTGITNSPRIVQIAWALTDGNGNELRTQSFIVRPVGFDIPLSATRVHGITTEVARRSGIDIATALEAFAKDIGGADLLVAHNAQFDNGVVCDEFRRAGRAEIPLVGKPLLCTMRSSTDFCKITVSGRRGYKWPSLEELHVVLFGGKFDSAHDALADVRACMRCFFELRRRGVVAGETRATYVRRDYDEDEEEDEEQNEEDQELFDEIDNLYEHIRDHEEVWVRRFLLQFETQRFLTDRQREILQDILSKLEERS